MTSIVLSLVQKKPRKRDALVKKNRSIRPGYDDDDSSGGGKRQKRRSEIQRFMAPWYEKNADHPWYRHEEPKRRRSADYRPAITFDDDSDLDEETPPVIRPWRMRRKEQQSKDDAAALPPSVNLCRALCSSGDRSSRRRCTNKSVTGENFCDGHIIEDDRKDGTLDMRCRFKNIRYHRCGNTVHGGHDYCYAHLDPDQRTGPPTTCTSCDGKSSKRKEDRSKHKLRLYFGSIRTLQCDVMNDRGQLCPYVAVESDVFCPLHIGSTSRVSVASKPNSGDVGTGAINSTVDPKSPPSNASEEQTSVKVKPQTASNVEGSAGATSVLKSPNKPATRKQQTASTLEGSASATAVLKSPQKDVAVEQTSVTSDKDPSDASNNNDCSDPSTSASSEPSKITVVNQSIPNNTLPVEEKSHRIFADDGSVSSTSALKAPPNAEQGRDDGERKVEWAESPLCDNEVREVNGIATSECDESESCKILFDTGNEDSSDSSSSDEEVEEMEESDVKNPFTYKEFERLWNRCEKKFGMTYRQIENTTRIRDASNGVKKTDTVGQDTVGQDKAQYGRILPQATQKVIHEILCLKEDDVFLDIGHGVGNTCVQVAYTAGCEARGIEIIYRRHAVAENIKEYMERRTEKTGQNIRKAIGKIELRAGSLKDEKHRDFLTVGVTRAYVNNYNGVMGARCETKGALLDTNIAGVFASLRPGSIMVTFDPLRALERTKEESNEVRRRYGLKESENASFFKREKVELGKACESVKWKDISGNQELIYLYKYERLEQPSEEAVFLCCNKDCDFAKDEVPIPATTTNIFGEIVINHCTCKVSAPILRKRNRVKYSK